MSLRYVEPSNSFARRLRERAFEQQSQSLVDEVTGAFSLSDCYLIKSESLFAFEQISPYFVDFWKGTGKWFGAVPSLYVNGSLDKYWDNSKHLIKIGKGVENEILAVQLCKACGIICNNAVAVPNGIRIENFTNPDCMLEPADTSGKFASESISDFSIAEVFDEKEMEMLVVDAIAVNVDRHASNFGFLCDINTGDYLGMVSLYDFNQVRILMTC